MNQLGKYLPKAVVVILTVLGILALYYNANLYFEYDNPTVLRFYMPKKGTLMINSVVSFIIIQIGVLNLVKHTNTKRAIFYMALLHLGMLIFSVVSTVL